MVTSPNAQASAEAFHLELENFTGPFDLLLSLINKRELDVTEVALAQVTDEFVSYIAGQEEWQLDEASEFLVIAATLLDLKAARLLPRGEVEDEQDLELLEARDLLFARLLQYRAYKQASQWVARRVEQQRLSHPREVGLEERFASILPELIWHITPEEFARIAAQAFKETQPPKMDLSHLHAPTVSVQEQAALLVTRLQRLRVVTFRQLVSDAGEIAMVVARFLALLELYKEHVIAFEQAAPLAELSVRWTGERDGKVQVSTEYDQ